MVRACHPAVACPLHGSQLFVPHIIILVMGDARERPLGRNCG